MFPKILNLIWKILEEELSDTIIFGAIIIKVIFCQQIYLVQLSILQNYIRP